MVGTKMYFLVAPNITVYDTAAKTWSSFSAAAAIAGMKDGLSLAGVEGPPGLAQDYLVVSGGGTNRVVSYSIATGKWTAMKGTLHANQNTCSVGCEGLFYTMTGNFKKEDSGGGLGKPADRQIYAYNLTTGAVFANNGEKTRGGAACACGEIGGPTPFFNPHDVFFSGGFSDGGMSAQVEVWRYPLARRGEPKLSMGHDVQYLGGAGCGGMAVFAGGADGSTLYNTVTVWPANLTDPATDKPHQFALPAGLRMPRVGCVAGRYAVISGGTAGTAGCNKAAYVLDTAALPAAGSKLPLVGTLNATGMVAVATSLHGDAIGFFDGTTLDTFHL